MAARSASPAATRSLPPVGFTEVFSRTLETAARNLETLSDPEAWVTIGLTLADMLLAVATSTEAPPRDGTGAGPAIFIVFARPSNASSTIPI